MKGSAPTGRLANSPARSPKRAERGLCTNTIDTAPIATPMTARSTTGASFNRTATGWETATTTSKVASTARSRTISNIGDESLSGRRVGGQLGDCAQRSADGKSEATQDETGPVEPSERPLDMAGLRKRAIRWSASVAC